MVLLWDDIHHLSPELGTRCVNCATLRELYWGDFGNRIRSLAACYNCMQCFRNWSDNCQTLSENCQTPYTFPYKILFLPDVGDISWILCMLWIWNHPWGGGYYLLTKAPLVNFSIIKILDIAKAPVRFFESHSYLTSVTAAKLRRHLSNINVIFNS